jgi:hypothetical protein
MEAFEKKRVEAVERLATVEVSIIATMAQKALARIDTLKVVEKNMWLKIPIRVVVAGSLIGLTLKGFDNMVCGDWEKMQTSGKLTSGREGELYQGDMSV